MTDEQIKQNAEEWADELKHTNSTIYVARYCAYIAGAHSRDEEIEKLERRIYELHEDNAGLTNNTTALSEELNKALIELSNPWISVKDRLPEKAIGKSERSKYVLCRHKNGSYYVAYWHVGLEYWYSMPYKIDKSNITHWMPIPELKKGELK